MQATDQEIQALYQALVQRDTQLWDDVWGIWSPRVAGWVRRHPQFRYTGEEVRYFVNRAFEKLWRAVDSLKLERFESPAQLIQYFKLCVHSVIVDELRGPQRDSQVVALSGDMLSEVAVTVQTVEDEAIGHLHREELWARIASHVKSEEERVLVEAALVRGMPPREIALRHPALFAGAHDVYRIKRNLLERLSRDPQIRNFCLG